MSGSINLTQSLVQKLGSSIVRGELPAGKPLPIEAELGKKFGASRTVMREAVKILSTKGLIGQRPRVGTLRASGREVGPARRRSPEMDSRPAFLARAWCASSSKCASASSRPPRRSPPPTPPMPTRNCSSRKLERMKAANEGHFDPVSADIAFHATILEISHNRFFHQLTPIIETALRFSIRLTNKVKGTLAGLRRPRKDLSRHPQRQCRRRVRSCRELIKEALVLVIKTDKADAEAARRFHEQIRNLAAPAACRPARPRLSVASHRR